MPRRKKYAKKRKYKKRMFKKRRRPRRSRLTMGGFPTSKKCLLRYATTVTLNPGAGQIVKHQFAANGCFDPDLTGTGHQPRGFDQWMQNYSHYTVIGSKITIKPYGPAARAGVSSPTMVYGVALNRDESFPWTTWVDLAESRFAGKGTTVALNVNQSRTMTRSFSAKKYFGALILGKGVYAGDVTKNPTEGSSFQVWAGSPDGSDPDSQQFMVQIDYIVVFTEPNYLGQS